MKMNKKGFTLMEMLIVVAIIAVLIAIAIPTFAATLERSREATDAANIRAAYAEAMSDMLTNGAASTKTAAAMTQATAGWANTEIGATKIGTAALSTISPVKGNTVTVTVALDGTTTLASGSGSK